MVEEGVGVAATEEVEAAMEEEEVVMELSR